MKKIFLCVLLLPALAACSAHQDPTPKANAVSSNMVVPGDGDGGSGGGTGTGSPGPGSGGDGGNVSGGPVTYVPSKTNPKYESAGPTPTSPQYGQSDDQYAYNVAGQYTKEETKLNGWTNVTWTMDNLGQFPPSDGVYYFRISNSALATSGPNGARQWYIYHWDSSSPHDGTTSGVYSDDVYPK